MTGTGRRVPYEEPRPTNVKELLLYPIELPRIPRPPVRKMLRRLPALVPERVKGSKGLRLARRHPGLAAWAMACAVVVLVIANFHLSPPDLYDLGYQKWMQLRGTKAVNAAFAEIGPGLPVPEVKAESMADYYLGWYRGSTHTVAFTTNHKLFDFEVLEIAAHESVHAIFRQNKMIPRSKTHEDFFSLVNETTASVLGAYIAGDAWTKQGEDGKSLSAHLVQSYRNTCDPTVEYSMYDRYLAPGRPASGEFDRARWYSVLIHFGPVKLVDAVDLIACQNPDPTEACRKVAERFMRENLSFRDQLIFEEFERTRARGPKPGTHGPG